MAAAQQTTNAADQLTAVLTNATSQDRNTRTQAEQQLKSMEGQNLPLYLTSLVAELGNEKKNPQTRQLAGLLVKNALFANDETVRAQLSARWAQQNEGVRKQIKQMLLQILASPTKDVRSTAAIVVATIASIEVPKKMWPDLVPALINNIAQAKSADVKQSSYEALGYVCEECPEHLQAASNMILNAIQAGMDKKETNNAIKLAATVALRNALEFTRENFGKTEERKLIFGMIFTAATSEDVKVRTAAYSCLVEVAGLYYNHLGGNITDAYNLTANAIKNEQVEVALQAIEFWSTICDVETQIQEEAAELKESGSTDKPREMFKFMATATPNIVPLLLQCLTKQSEDPEDDTWNPAMAAGTALGLIALCVGDVVVPPVLPFVQANLVSKDWRLKEAATLAFGSILDGPAKEKLQPLVKTALPVLLGHLKDSSAIVKDTAAWTLGRICNLVPESLGESLPQVMQAFVLGLNDKPKVAANVCWAIHNLADSVRHNGQTSPLSKYFEIVMRALVATTERTDTDEANLLSSAYEAINVMIHSAAADSFGTIGQMVGTLLARLKQTFLMQGLTAEEREKQNEVQALLCGSLQSIIQKLDTKVIAANADNMMSLFLAVLQSKKNASVHEEALMAISALANRVGDQFAKYMQAFKPFLLAGLRATQEQHVLTVAVGVVGDVSRALESKVAPFCDDLMQLLLQNLQSGAVDRNVKPHIIGAISDVALAVGGHFERYLKWVMQFLVQASQTTFPDMDQENAEYLMTLRESVLEAYTGILTGMGSDGKVAQLGTYVDSIFAFLDLLSKDSDISGDVLKAAIGVIGDLAAQMGASIVQKLGHQCVSTLVTAGMNSDDGDIKKAANWAKEQCYAAAKKK